MDVHFFFATPLAPGYSKGEEEFDTPIFIVGGKRYAESQARSATKRATKPGTR
jgi:hypothetical protein